MRFRFFSRLTFTTGLLVLSLQIATTTAATTTKTRTPVETNLANDPANAVSTARKAERIYYAEAKNALEKHQMARYNDMLSKLKNYPLLPYLEYQELGDRLMSLPRKEVDQFFSRYPNSYLSERLLHRWLRTLAFQNLWPDYLRYYNLNLTDPELACLYSRARLASGDKTALKDVALLWNVEKPQSKACDPVFAEWKQAGLLTPELLWTRLVKAVKADEIGLANSLIQDMSPTQQTFAMQYENVAQNPRLILQPDQFNLQSPEARASIVLGLERYSQTNPTGALEIWNTYEKRGNFNADEQTQIKYSIARNLLRQDKNQLAEEVVAATPNLSHPDLLEALIREALRKQDWEKSYRWISRLPAEQLSTERWRYWQARVMEELHINTLNGKKPNDIYASIASTRGFYGFLSSDRLGSPYSLLDKPLPLSKDFMRQVEMSPGIQRAREFYLLGDIGSASREWIHTTHHASTEEMVAAGRLADKWGWYGQAIETMYDSQYWDELQTRFPIVFHENIKTAARQTSVDPHFIFAITRQESAFNTGAKSPVGAMGLMQLMPATAKSTAKKSGLTFKPQDLLQADKNIALGSRYLDELLGAFSGNRILAAAAYNAGPSRVKQWMNKDDNKLAYDVWIETIPYKETRNYVQNILSFAVIYGYRIGNKQVFITPEEAAQLL